MSTHFKWAALFLLFILLPAGLLTYVSVQAFRDEQRSALADLNLLVPRLQNTFDRLINRAVQDTSSARIVAHFVLDAKGQWVQPRVLPLIFGERSKPFSDALNAGAMAEFREVDLVAARKYYETALDQSTNRSETAEALNAIGRVALSLQDTLLALNTHEALKDLADVLDADGAHPLTLSTIRLIQALPRSQAYALAQNWVDGIRHKRGPIHPGTQIAVQALRDRFGKRASHRRAYAPMLASLSWIEHRVDLAMNLERLQPSGVNARGHTFHSGAGTNGKSILISLRSAQNDHMQGRWIDLDAMADTLIQTPTGKLVRENGFALSIFDIDLADDFQTHHAQAIHMITPASAMCYRINFGLFARSDLQVLRRYRQRNALIVLGVLGLAGLIAVGALLIYRDITREITLARLQSEFVSNVSHELRTPLTAIRMYAETLRMGRTRSDDQMQTYLDTIMQESQRLARMVGNILDFSRMESGRKTYRLTPCNPAAPVQSVVAEFEPIFREQGFELTVDLASDLPLMPMDREAIEGALANLLSNALKYARDEKSVSVRVWAASGSLNIEVADRGIGVPEKDQKAIFHKYHRGSNAKATGTGLGLALVKGVMDAHGGTITYQPRKNGGSIFQLTLKAAY